MCVWRVVVGYMYLETRGGGGGGGWLGGGSCVHTACAGQLPCGMLSTQQQEREPLSHVLAPSPQRALHLYLPCTPPRTPTHHATPSHTWQAAALVWNAAARVWISLAVARPCVRCVGPCEPERHGAGAGSSAAFLGAAQRTGWQPSALYITSIPIPPTCPPSQTPPTHSPTHPQRCARSFPTKPAAWSPS